MVGSLQVDPGETPEAALCRELQEELNIQVGHNRINIVKPSCRHPAPATTGLSWTSALSVRRSDNSPR